MRISLIRLFASTGPFLLKMNRSKKIIECVPNFSEGKNQEVIQKIADAIKSVPGVSLLDVDPGVSTNRTVYTIVGSPDCVVDGALAGAKTAYDLIDMRKHEGEHMRLGALDVCPFIPVQGVEMEEAVYCQYQKVVTRDH